MSLNRDRKPLHAGPNSFRRLTTRVFVRYHEKLGPIIVERSGREENAHLVEIRGPSRMVFKPHAEHPRIWLETEALVEIIR